MTSFLKNTSKQSVPRITAIIISTTSNRILYSSVSLFSSHIYITVTGISIYPIRATFLLSASLIKLLKGAEVTSYFCASTMFLLIADTLAPVSSNGITGACSPGSCINRHFGSLLINSVLIIIMLTEFPSLSSSWEL